MGNLLLVRKCVFWFDMVIRVGLVSSLVRLVCLSRFSMVLKGKFGSFEKKSEKVFVGECG